MKVAEPRFYVDADLLGLAKVLCEVRNDVTYPGFPGGKKFGRIRPSCRVTSTATPDEIWIPETAKAGWIVITRDSAIQERRAEINAVRESGARLIALVGRDANTTWDQLSLVTRRWDRIEAARNEDGPFILALSKTSVRRIDLNR